MSSKVGELKMRFISLRIQHRSSLYSRDYGRKKLPIPRVGAGDGVPVDSEEAVECAVIALSSWNDKIRSEQGPEYEFVGALGCKRMAGPTIYHCNFTARPRNSSEAENKLFFAELKYSKDFAKDGEDVALGCLLCCILGPSGIETEFMCCRICDYSPIRIHHPGNEKFTTGRKNAYWKYRFSKMREPSDDELVFEYDGTIPEDEARKYADMALSEWNKTSLSEQGPEYELVELLKGNSMVDPFINHLNFIAGPKNGSEAESKLFFAEMMYIDSIESMGATVCCILGPRGTKTGTFGCRFCENHYSCVQHPEYEDFTKGTNDWFAKETRAKNKRKREKKRADLEMAKLLHNEDELAASMATASSHQMGYKKLKT